MGKDALTVGLVEKAVAARLVEAHHYLHRVPPMSFAFALRETWWGDPVGIVTLGVPASRHMQISACPTEPSAVVELNRLWVDDRLPRNTESWFLAQVLRGLPPHIVVSYADTAQGHVGYVYRASNWNYAGWTDMDRKTPRFDYHVPGKHSRDAFRQDGPVMRIRRKPKAKYWTATGNRRERRDLIRLCGWPSLSWKERPLPCEAAAA